MEAITKTYGTLEAHREQIRLHCYRMTGSLNDAEDLTQEVLVRSWQKLSGFRGESALLTWLYRIATNTCLDFLRDKKRRRMTYDSDDWLYQGESELPVALTEPLWLEPYPDPEGAAFKKEQVSLAFLQLLQTLPPVQRAALILCDVLDYSAKETGSLLSLSRMAVSSALQRARKTLKNRPSPPSVDSADRQVVLDRFLKAWESADARAIVDLMIEDTRFTMPPVPLWARGTSDIYRILLDFPFRYGDARRWKLVPVAGANGESAMGFYEFLDGVYQPWGMQVLVLGQGSGGRLPPIVEYHVFKGPRLVELFGLPQAISR